MFRINPVFFYIPNIIDYFRILLLAAACFYMSRNYVTTLILYGISQFLDCIDGYVARLLNQTSALGVVLDMLTDRCSTLCFFVYLSLLYPSYYFIFQFLAVLDIFSHWAIVHSSILFRKDSHKTFTIQQHPILYIYYTNKLVMFAACVGNELFVMFLYASNYHKTKIMSLFGMEANMFHVGALAMSPFFIFKQLTNILQLHHSMKQLSRFKLNFKSKSKVKDS